MVSRNYEEIRNNFLGQHEGERFHVYFDTVGISTTSKGYALIARPNQYNGQRWTVDENRVGFMSEVLGHSPAEKRQFHNLMSQLAEARQQNNFTGQIRNDREFERSDFGQAAQRIVGRFASGRAILTNQTNSPMTIALTPAQSTRLFSKAVQEKEDILDRIVLRRNNCPPEALSDKQRTALVSMVYHGTTDQAGRIATQIGKYYRGEINAQQLNQQIDTLGANPRYAGRAKQQINYLKDLGPRLRQQRSEAEPFNASPKAIRTVEALHEKLQANVGKQIEAAGAGRFADSMVAECTYQCIKKGITAENINHMFVDTNQNRIFIDTKLDGKIAVIDAFEAAKVDPTERLQAATQTQEEKVQQQIQEQNLQLAQQQERSGPKMG